jgi:SagB-type dehydrogenase family enzyme
VLHTTTKNRIKLPRPRHNGGLSVEQALLQRRSVRDFKSGSLTLAEVSQLLWAAQGTTDPGGFRTAPSAGALYPLEIYIVVGQLEELGAGVYKYIPFDHQLVRIAEGDKRRELSTAALNQSWVKNNAALLVFSAVEYRTTQKYGRRGIRYVHIEVGHAAQNVFLQATALNLGAAVVGAFDDESVERIMAMPADEHPLYLMPIGRK